MWWLTAEGVTPSSSAARLKLPCREAASNANNAFSGGILGRCVDSASSAAEFFELALIMAARYEYRCCLRQLSYRERLEATGSCSKTGSPASGAAPCGGL